MNKVIWFMLISASVKAQSYAPEPGQAGSTAIHMDSVIIIDWASNVTVERGYMNIQNPSAGIATYGSELDAIGHADGLSVVSLGDSGVATVEFTAPIVNGPGPDFVIFENGFINHYMELAFVEVSSNGVDFIRFNSVSEIPTVVQLTNFDTSNCAYVHNLAGKYRVEYGTPFDLEDLVGSASLDLNNIQYVKIIDVVGSIDPQVGSMDYLGALINDPYPTEWESGGFDLEAVGVINSAEASLFEIRKRVQVYPNPTRDVIKVSGMMPQTISCYSSAGILVDVICPEANMISVHQLPSGVYYLQIEDENADKYYHKIIKL